MRMTNHLLFTVIICCFLAVANVYGQDKTISLGQVIDSALKHSPVSAQRMELNELSALSDKQLKVILYPSIQAGAQASIQSDVTSLPISFPGISIPEMKKDWYKVNVDLTQVVYDGGQVKQARLVEEANKQTRLLEIEQQENNLREMISKLYFRAVLLRQQQKVYASAIRSLEASAEELKIAVKEGVVLASAMQSLQAEILRTKQQMIEAKGSLTSTLTMLEGFTKMKISVTDSLLLPRLTDQNIAMLQQKADWQIIEKQIEKIKIQQQLSVAKRRPSVQAFAQAGYGRPGYNMLDDNFDDYYMAGLRINYKLWDWKTSRREQQMLKLNGNILKKSREAFEISQGAAFNAKEAEIAHILQLIETDHEIVRLQEEIIATQKVNLLQGTITSSAYTQEVEKLTRARIGLETNAIRLINSKAELMYITGKYAIYE